MYSPSRWLAMSLIFMIVAAALGLGYLVYRLGLPAFQEVLDYGYGNTGTQAARDTLNYTSRVSDGFSLRAHGIAGGRRGRDRDHD